jgi:hypothetical protein
MITVITMPPRMISSVHGIKFPLGDPSSSSKNEGAGVGTDIFEYFFTATAEPSV